jgi:DNA-binding transcriptional regulator YiaG
MGLTQKQIGQRIMELRKAKGLSQEYLAEWFKISGPHLLKLTWEQRCQYS